MKRKRNRAAFDNNTYKKYDPENEPLCKRQRRRVIAKKRNELIDQMRNNLPQNPYKLYPGIRFDHNSRLIQIMQPLDLNELKLIVRKKCNIKLRSDRIESKDGQRSYT